MQEAHQNGMSVVIICAQADAEDHCMQLRGNGLLSSIEPAGDGCWWHLFNGVNAIKGEIENIGCT